MVDNFVVKTSTQGEKAFLEKALAVYRETHNIADTSEPAHMIDDTERAVVMQGNQLLKNLLENHINERIIKEELRNPRLCPDCKKTGEKTRNRGGKKKRSTPQSEK